MERAEHEDTRRGGKATLYVVATPIGNLEDITLRALNILKEVDVIAAEDTRVTARLLTHHGIGHKKMIPVHEHNERRSAQQVISQLDAGRSVALTSDAGTPAFSDPGAHLVSAARHAGYPVVPIPGPNAAATALSASGFAAPPFLFNGFLPAKAAERRRVVRSLAKLPYLLVFYEAPHRVRETVEDLAAELGSARRVVIARELTKLFESIHACTLAQAGAWLDADANRVKGEFVLIVEGARASESADDSEAERTLALLLEALPVSQAAALAARITGANKNALYARALELRKTAS